MTRPAAQSSADRMRSVHAQEEASGPIEEHIDLSKRDSQAFIEALINPRPVNERLRETIRRIGKRSASDEPGLPHPLNAGSVSPFTPTSSANRPPGLFWPAKCSCGRLSTAVVT